MKAKACPRCHGLEQWHIEPMLEHGVIGGGNSKLPLGFKDDLAPLRTQICHHCGYAVWYSGGVSSLTRHDGRFERDVDRQRPCRDCGGQVHYRLAEVKEWPQASGGAAGQRVPLALLRDGRSRRDGKLALRVCQRCGHGEWYAWGIATDDAERIADQCRSCHSVDRRVVAKIHEDGELALPVAWKDDRELGHFELRYCASCGLCDWFARDLDRLSADGEYIRFVKAAPARNTRLAGGPYR